MKPPPSGDSVAFAEFSLGIEIDLRSRAAKWSINQLFWEDMENVNLHGDAVRNRNNEGSTNTTL